MGGGGGRASQMSDCAPPWGGGDKVLPGNSGGPSGGAAIKGEWCRHALLAVFHCSFQTSFGNSPPLMQTERETLVSLPPPPPSSSPCFHTAHQREQASPIVVCRGHLNSGTAKNQLRGGEGECHRPGRKRRWWLAAPLAKGGRGGKGRDE